MQNWCPSCDKDHHKVWDDLHAICGKCSKVLYGNLKNLTKKEPWGRDGYTETELSSALKLRPLRS